MVLSRRLTLTATVMMAILSFAIETRSQTARTPGAIAHASPPDIASLLKSRDPREQAWAAWYVGAGRLHHVAPLLQGLVREHLRARPSSDATLDIALDARIQLQSPLDAEVLPDLYAIRPAQALIAASLMDQNSDQFLRDVVRTAKGHDWFAAANLLLTRSPRTLVPGVLESLRLKVKVYLVDKGHMMGGGDDGGGGVGCGGGGLAPGMPPWPTYALTSFPNAGVTVLATGPKTIYYRRAVSQPGQGPAASVTHIGGPTGDDRLKYAAAAAGIELPILPLRGYEQHSLSVRDRSSLEFELTRIRTDLLQRYQRFMAMLGELNIVPAGLATTYQPEVDFDIEDHRRDSFAIQSQEQIIETPDMTGIPRSNHAAGHALVAAGDLRRIRAHSPSVDRTRGPVRQRTVHAPESGGHGPRDWVVRREMPWRRTHGKRWKVIAIRIAPPRST